MPSNQQVATITMAEGAVNPLSLTLRRFIIDELDKANLDPAISAIVLTGSARAFSAGADIAEFGLPSALASPTLQAVIDAVEGSSKPVVAAIDGLALGGGLELAMAAHGRVAHPRARLGLPETHLGLIPGAGGTQRLPRALGLEQGAQYLLDGALFHATDVVSSALIDELSEEPIKAAQLLAARIGSGERPRVLVSNLVLPKSQSQALLAAIGRAYVKGSAAQLGVIEALNGAVAGDFAHGLRVEGAVFDRLYSSRTARALRHARLIERKIVNPVPPSANCGSVEKVGIVGSGTMGRGIALSIAQAGIRVLIHDQDAAALDRCAAHIRDTLARAVAKGKQSQGQADATLASLAFVATLDALADADLVIEAVYEDLQVKSAVLCALDGICQPRTLLASNTSTLDIDHLASLTGRPGRVLGLHFFSPANIMRLLEVVRGARTEEAVLGTALAFARRIGKVAVVSGVCDGFIGNRMINAYVDEAMWLLEDGVSPYRIDALVEQWGMAMGPFRMMDLAGNDISWSIRKRRLAQHPAAAVSRIADPLCEAGRFGQKTGLGWYAYPQERKAVVDPYVEQQLREWNAQQGNPARVVSDEEILDRLLLALVNEGAHLLGEGIALSCADIDAVYLSGYGFAASKGGPMFWASEEGAYAVVRRMRGLGRVARQNPAFWQPAPLLCSAARQGKRLDEIDLQELGHE